MHLWIWREGERFLYADLATVSSWSHGFVALTYRKLIGLKVKEYKRLSRTDRGVCECPEDVSVNNEEDSVEQGNAKVTSGQCVETWVPLDFCQSCCWGGWVRYRSAFRGYRILQTPSNSTSPNDINLICVLLHPCSCESSMTSRPSEVTATEMYSDIFNILSVKSRMYGERFWYFTTSKQPVRGDEKGHSLGVLYTHCLMGRKWAPWPQTRSHHIIYLVLWSVIIWVLRSCSGGLCPGNTPGGLPPRSCPRWWIHWPGREPRHCGHLISQITKVWQLTPHTGLQLIW